MSVYLRILRYLRPQRRLFGLAIVAMTIDNALDAFSFTLLIPFLDLLFNGGQTVARTSQAFGGGAVGRLLRWTVGGLVQGNEPMVALRNVVALLFLVYLLKNVANYIWSVLVTVIEGRVTRDLRNDIYAHLLRLGFPFFQRTRAGQVISRVTNDVDQMRALVTNNLAKLLSSIIQALVYVTMLLLLSWQLTLVALLFVPLTAMLWGRLRKRLRRGVMKVLDAVGEVASHVQETVSGIRLVKASGAEAFEEERFRALTRRHYKALVRNDRWRKFIPPATEMISAATILALLWYGTWLVLGARTLTPSELLAALMFAGKLAVPVKFIGNYPAQVQPGLAAAERAFELVDRPIEVIDRADAAPFPGFRRELRFERVGFAYSPDTPVLEEIDLSIRPGEVVALVGPSGAGKSTLADLVPRFHDPTSGHITLDGVDLRDLRLAEVRGILGIVTQETILFHDTVRANIAYGRTDAPQAEVEAAARAANAHEFIAALPSGYDTVLGEKGTRLSGGQRQRIAIARALLRNPPLLILDEATSALDTESERLVQQAIDEVMAHRAVLVIAHRLSTVRRADQIVVLDRGRIVERGTHDELLRLNGVYRRLYDLQFAVEDERAESPLVEAVD
ncbi:ABC transporter ATP-binding protein [Longimicrobium sp.]|uniref:ABC transporter ATP-binding protein n=1 Tax=Longimicrobium sp. TaxID=2029185 RepID=UPI002B510833|nr:ABC transporter ATP-binding protein [Longimicrobium sp.]HSU12946.1 ABC transporter ATP-binding protein [Longimicrobium sp.]